MRGYLGRGTWWLAMRGYLGRGTWWLVMRGYLGRGTWWLVMRGYLGRGTWWLAMRGYLARASEGKIRWSGKQINNEVGGLGEARPQQRNVERCRCFPIWVWGFAPVLPVVHY